MADCMLTTIDNPFNPFKELYAWYNYDTKVAHHNTWSTLVADYKTSHRVDDTIAEQEARDLVDDFLRRNPTGLYVKVYDYEADSLIPLLNKVFRESQQSNS